MDVLRAPDAAVRALPDYPFASHYVDVPCEPGALETLRVHYVDEGPRDGRPVVLRLTRQEIEKSFERI